MKFDDKPEVFVTERADAYLNDGFGGAHGLNYEYKGIIGNDIITILEFLNGRSWDDRALSYIHAVHPSMVRVIKYGCGEKLDSVSDRVTVYLDKDNRTIKKIKQEVQVALPWVSVKEFKKQFENLGVDLNDGEIHLIERVGDCIVNKAAIFRIGI